MFEKRDYDKIKSEMEKEWIELINKKIYSSIEDCIREGYDSIYVSCSDYKVGIKTFILTNLDKFNFKLEIKLYRNSHKYTDIYLYPTQEKDMVLSVDGVGITSFDELPTGSNDFIISATKSILNQMSSDK